MPAAITVGATTPGDARASFSNFGYAVDYIMPGAGILSTYKGGGYRTADGTSMAAPHLAGILARDLAMDNALDDTISEGSITGPDREYQLRVDPTTSAPAPEETSDPAG